jgi:hypothetical protein
LVDEKNVLPPSVEYANVAPFGLGQHRQALDFFKDFSPMFALTCVDFTLPEKPFKTRKILLVANAFIA